MASFRDLARGMDKESKEVIRKGTMTLRRCASDVLRNVILGTPVGNTNVWLEPNKAPVGYVGGRARANWMVNIGSPSEMLTDMVDAGGSSSISRGNAVIEKAIHNSVIHLTNNLPYIRPLNEGHSKQAPAGFIEQAIQEGVVSGGTRGSKE